MRPTARPAWPGRRSAVLLAAGAAHALAFAPGPLPAWLLPLLQIAALAVPARLALDAPTLRRAAADGWLFGLATYALGLYWLYISMHTYGYMAAPLAAAGVLVLAAGLAAYPALACALACRLAPHGGGAHARTGGVPEGAADPADPADPADSADSAGAAGAAGAANPGGAAGVRFGVGAALVWASAWTVGEWLRGTVFTGFPWLNAGYGHVDGPYAGWAPVAGVYGVAFLAAFAAAALAGLWRPAPGAGAAAAAASDEHPLAAPPPAQPRRAVAAGIAVAAALAGMALARVPWSQPHGQPLEVRLVQGAIDQGEKFDPARMRAAIARHLDHAGLPPVEGAPVPQLVMLPETIMPTFQDRIDPAVWQAWRDLAARDGATILMGAPLRDAATGGYTNSVIGITADTPLAALLAGRPAMRYDKHHLVPFGEFVPPGLRWFVDAMTIPLGDFDRGDPRQPPFAVRDQYVAPDICYEDVFGEELLPALHPGEDGTPGATILANFSNLGWFGDSWALRQHLQIARMRALETARPMLRATNTGATAAIAPDGRVLIQAEPMQPRVIGLPVQGMTGLTPYARAGNLPVLALAMLCLGAAAARRRPQA